LRSSPGGPQSITASPPARRHLDLVSTRITYGRQGRPTRDHTTIGPAIPRQHAGTQERGAYMATAKVRSGCGCSRGVSSPGCSSPTSTWSPVPSGRTPPSLASGGGGRRRDSPLDGRQRPAPTSGEGATETPVWRLHASYRAGFADSRLLAVRQPSSRPKRSRPMKYVTGPINPSQWADGGSHRGRSSIRDDDSPTGRPTVDNTGGSADLPVC
jgi:hypothetical protein